MILHDREALDHNKRGERVKTIEYRFYEVSNENKERAERSAS